jgi:hypothetical protein
MGKDESEVKEARARRLRKQERDREYWGRHRPKLNRKRRQRYAAERKLLEGAEEGE